MGHSSYDPIEQGLAWNEGKRLGAKRPPKPKEYGRSASCLIASIGFEIARCCIIDIKLRGCELNDIADELDAEAAEIGAEGNGPPIPMPPVS